MEQRLRRVNGSELKEVAPPAESADPLLDHAGRLGFELVSYQTETDQTVWEWRHGDGPRPQFVTERVARQWMTEWLARQPPTAPAEPLDDRRRAREQAAAHAPTAESA